MKKNYLLLIALFVFAPHFLYATSFFKCDESLVYDYSLRDALDQARFSENAQYFCSAGVNHILRRAKNIMKDDAAQFYSMQISTIESCLKKTMSIFDESHVQQKTTVYFHLDTEEVSSSDFESVNGIVVLAMQTENVLVVMQDTHEVGNHINKDKPLPYYEVDMQDIMNVRSIAQSLNTLLCKKPRA